MAELFKNIYNEKFFNRFTKTVKEVKSDFNKKAFLKDIYDSEWEARELKQRMRHITITLENHLDGSYNSKIDFILKLIPQ